MPRINKILGVVQNVETMLSGLSIVQTRLGAADATEALERIYTWSATDDGSQDPPRMMVAANRGSWRWQAGLVGFTPVHCMVQWPVPESNVRNESVQWEWFSEQVETLCDEIQDAVNAATASPELSLETLDFELGPIRKEDIPAEWAARVVWWAHLELGIAV
jgi:hypothetical protein